MKNNNIKLKKPQLKEIPIFFATDDNYVPFLDVAIRSIIKNASTRYNYTINVLNTGLKEENMRLVKKQENKNLKINFVNITDCIASIKNKLRNVYHFGLAAYYRLFIQSLFPNYHKVLYLDCDIIALGDISKLYNTKMDGNWIAAIPDQVVASNSDFCTYVDSALGIKPFRYINSGVMIMDLDKFRENDIENKFTYLINTYNFDTVAPDQDYLNVLCKDKIKYLPNGWNKACLPLPVQGSLNLIHYNLYKKPWQVDDVINGNYFWEYAQDSPFIEEIKLRKNSFTEEDKLKKEAANVEIVEHALKIVQSNNTFYKVVFKQNALSEFKQFA